MSWRHAALQIAVVALVGCTGKEAMIPLLLPQYVAPSAPKTQCELSPAVDARISGCPSYDANAARITRANANGKQMHTGLCFLGVAALRRERDLIFELLDNGADIRKCGGLDVFHHWMIGLGSGLNPCAEGTDKVFGEIEQRGLSPSNLDELLVTAIVRGCNSAIPFFVNRGADVNRPNRSGLRPLFYAMNPSRTTSPEAVRLLRVAGADPSLIVSVKNHESLRVGSICEVSQEVYGSLRNWARIQEVLPECFR